MSGLHFNEKTFYQPDKKARNGSYSKEILFVIAAIFSAGTLANPDLAFLLLALGILGVYMEFSRPGFVLPGVLGATLTLIALSALTKFPFTLRGALLIVFALCLFVLEALFATRGILMVAGIAAMVEGALRLIDSTEPALRIHPNVALAVTVPFAFITTFLLSIAVRARRNKAVINAESPYQKPDRQDNVRSPQPGQLR